eukprot:scaffold5385_cov152-Amphora_coffeaeformis.AAC.7
MMSELWVRELNAFLSLARSEDAKRRVYAFSLVACPVLCGYVIARDLSCTAQPLQTLMLSVGPHDLKM